MHNTFLASTISVRTKGSTPSSFGYYARCSNERNPFVDSTCCSCYCNTMYDAPRMQGYFYNWYGLRQSCLSKRPHCRKPIRSGLGSRYCARLPVCDRNGSCFCDDMCRLRQGSSLGWRKGGLRQCRVLEEMREWDDDEGVEEVEVVLSFLAEDVCEECDGLRKEKVRLVKKSVVENRDDCEVSSKIRRKKRGDDLGVFKGEHRRGRYSVGSHKKKDDRREEGNRRDDEKEALAWEKHRRAELSEEHGNALQTEIREGREEDTKTLLRKTSQKKEEKKQRESCIRKEDLKASSRIDERREEHEQKVRKEGSSGSSLYSRSADDYYSNIDGELREGGFLEDSFATCGEGDSRRNKIVLQKGEEGDQSCKDYREDHGIFSTKERTERASHVGSFLESDFTKKSEKKLVNLSVQDMESGKETSQKDSNLSMTNESRYKKSSDHYARHDDDRQAELNMKSNHEGNLQHWQTSDEISGQSETRMKYKQFGGIQDSHGDDIIKSHGSQKLLSTRSKVSSGSANSSQKAVGEHRMAVGGNKMDDDYQKNSHKIIRISEIQEIDSIKKTSSTLHKFKGRFKQEDNSTNIHSSVNDSAKQQQQSGHVGGLIQSMGESQKLTEKECKSIPKRISNNTIQEEENLNLASVLSLESKELPSQAHTNILKGYNSEKGFNKLVNISFSHSQDSGTIDLKGTRMTKSEIVHEKQQQNVMQYSSGDFQSKKHDLGYDDQDSGTKGPSDEMWNVDDDPSVQEQSREGFQSDSSKASKAIVKGAGRSFWGIISDFVQLPWFHHAENHSSGRKAAGNSSPCHHFSSMETWFSGHEAEENEDADGNKEAKSITQGSYSSQPERKNLSQFEEGPSSFPLEGPLKHVGVNAPFSSKSLERGSQPINTPLYSEVSKKAKSAIDAPEPKQKILQRKDHYIEDRFDEWENVYRLEVEQRRMDEMFMREALLEAQKAADHWEVPVGAVLVHGGKIIARGFNLVEEMRDSTAHAEMICIREASNMLQTWRLSETTLYVTLEPCLMCAGAILQARIDTVVWGAPNKLLGADGSWIRLFPSRDRGNGLELSDKPAAPVHPFHPNIVIRYGVLASECADVMQQFFKLRRKNKDKKPDPSMSPPSCLPVPQQHPHNFLAKIHDALNLMFCL